MMRWLSSLYVFYSLLYLVSLSSLIVSVSCAGSSPTLVDPKNTNLPRLSDFRQCSYSESLCDGKYYCPNGLICFLRTCQLPYNTIKFPEPETDVPLCVEPDTQSKIMYLTAAIGFVESPRDVMRGTADACDVSKQVVIINAVRTFRPLDIFSGMSPSTAKLYTAYDIELGFFYASDPDKQVDYAAWRFVEQLKLYQSSLVDSHTTSLDKPVGILVNTSNIRITPATFSIQRCSDGTAVTGSETCPPIDPALVHNNAASSSSTSATTRLLTIILPIVGGVVFCALIVAALVIVRRRQANKVMRQTIQHTEPTVEVAMA